ncbi:flagellar motor switch protein FliN [Oceanicoccus sagamiensis]|uniref:Flagellar motor switch protein FliN n=1 Tax=Oceanicoccus sagamiensis TaxID=716816 RepID=A0A1X9NBL4_9GAMM|nr:flagellar motor switch protein FliN [Oceanicoccus sagamiensis]ARN75420.1 flagellar motor switch protein FliN [Oceanicoccus sagamiensis]
MSDDDKTDQDAMADDWAAAMAEQGDEGGQDDIDAVLAEANVDVQPAPMDEFAATPATAVEGAPDLDVIMDIPVNISMEVGNTEISIRNLLQLNQGSVIELDRLAGEPLDVLVNGTLIAHGEVVVVNEKFGIRMTDVISPSERIKKLR